MFLGGDSCVYVTLYIIYILCVYVCVSSNLI